MTALKSRAIRTACDRQKRTGGSGPYTVAMPYETSTVVQEPGGGRRGSRLSACSSPRCATTCAQTNRGRQGMRAAGRASSSGLRTGVPWTHFGHTRLRNGGYLVV